MCVCMCVCVCVHIRACLCRPRENYMKLHGGAPQPGLWLQYPTILDVYRALNGTVYRILGKFRGVKLSWIPRFSQTTFANRCILYIDV